MEQWMSWKTSPDDFVEFEAQILHNSDSLKKENVPSERKNSDGKKEGCREEVVYTPIWESYIASNYLFYNSLVVHFLGLAHKFLHTNVETVVQMVLKVCLACLGHMFARISIHNCSCFIVISPICFKFLFYS